MARLGETFYRLLYGLLSIAVLAWLISAAVRAPAIVLWWPQQWHAFVPLALMPFSLSLIGAAALSPNPLSINLRSLPYRPESPGIVSVTRHPMLWGFALWTLSHLIANGDLVSAILFGGLAIFALLGMGTLDRKMQARLGADEWHRLADNTSAVPFAAVLSGNMKLHIDRRLVLGVLLGVAMYIWMLFQGHDLLFGVAPLGLVEL